MKQTQKKQAKDTIGVVDLQMIFWAKPNRLILLLPMLMVYFALDSLTIRNEITNCHVHDCWLYWHPNEQWWVFFRFVCSVSLIWCCFNDNNMRRKHSNKKTHRSMVEIGKIAPAPNSSPSSTEMSMRKSAYWHTTLSSPFLLIECICLLRFFPALLAIQLLCIYVQ